MANVLLGVTGSVAAIKTLELFRSLAAQEHQVRVVATSASLYFFDPLELTREVGKAKRDARVVILDEDEWPGRGEGRRYRREDSVLHIELRRWADLLLVAPLDANTLAKFANGLADNCLTCVWRAWDTTRPVVLAPAMNTLMWEHPFTLRHLHQLAVDCRVATAGESSVEQLINQINASAPCLRIVPPVSRRLACGDVGVGAMASLDQIVEMVQTMTKSSKLSS
jgi:phosphopantothenoylcysteine decarboxylase